MYQHYLDGYSLSQVAKMYGVTRQSVYVRFKRAKLSMRTKKRLPFVVFNGHKYTLRKCGYYGKTLGGRSYLHRDVWESFCGEKIPNGWDIHHIDENKENNDISNLMIIEKSQHAKLHNTKKTA